MPPTPPHTVSLWSSSLQSRTAEKCCWTTSSPWRTSSRHIWSLSHIHQVPFWVPGRSEKNARRSSPFNYSITRMETVITWKPRTSPRRRRVWSALRWWRVGANWQQVQMCFKSYIHARADIPSTRGRAAQHSAARRKPEQTAASPNQIWHHLLLVLMHCHQPQRGARFGFFLFVFLFFFFFLFFFLFNNIKTQTQILALALLFSGCSVPWCSVRLLLNVSRYFCACSRMSLSPSIHGASVLLTQPPLPPSTWECSVVLTHEDSGDMREMEYCVLPFHDLL